MISRRTQIVLLVLMVCSVLLLTGLWKNSIGPSRSATVELAQTREETTRARALAILGAWDERRAKAYAQGDADALVELYLAGSDSGDNDRQVLTKYLARGLRVQGMRTQILDLEINHHDAGSMSLRVTDRLSSAVAVGPGVRLRLPRDQATTREIELHRVGLHWLVGEVRVAEPPPGEQPGDPAGERASDQPATGRSSAEESTSTTPLSRKS